MSSMLFLIVTAVALLMASLALGAAIFFWLRYQNPEPSLLQERLTRMKERSSEEASFEAQEQAKKVARLYKEADYKNENLGKRLEQLRLFTVLKLRLQQAGLKTPADQFFLKSMLIPIVLMSVLGVFSGFLELSLVGPVIAGLSYMYVLLMRSKRYKKFVTLLPDTLSMITSALRAGHSFQSALTVVSTEMPDPISTEFTALVRDINLGIPVREALGRLMSRLDTLPDVRMFVTAVSIQREAGGNLAEVLENLGYTIRERFKLKGQIAALTGQSRLTGYVLGCAPVGILAFLSIAMYDYVSPLYETDMGHLALITVVVMQAIGFLVIRKIIDIRV